MAVISTGLLEASLRSEFFEAYDSTLQHYLELATRLASTTDRERFRWLGTIPPMREWGTGRLAKGLRSESYDVENLKYEATVEVDRDEIEDDQTGQIRMRVAELGEAAATHKDYLIEQLLINGAAAGYNSYDGVTFFNAAHVSGDSGSQDNDLTAAIVDGSNPTVAEFRAALTQAIATMIAFKDDRGLPKRIAPTGLVCVVPPTMLFTALEAINLQLVGTGGTPLQQNVIQNAASIISLPGLTTATTWYLLKTDVQVRPFIFQDRSPVEFASVAEGSEEEFKREKYLYGVRARYRMTYGYWQHAIRFVFTTA